MVIWQIRVQSKQKQIKETQYKVLLEKRYENFEQAFNQLGSLKRSKEND